MVRAAVPALVLTAVLAACAGSGDRLPPGSYRPNPSSDDFVLPPDRLAALREDALPRTRVWREPAVPVAQADLRSNPPGADGFAEDAILVCRYHYHRSFGYTPKFRCVLPDGDALKVKYGRTSREVRTEVAATRLLAALGFGADRMYVVQRVRCFGCPPYPHEKLGLFNALFVDYDRSRDFDFVAIERQVDGAEIQWEGKAGWGFEELARIEPARGGSSRAEVDALRLMAVFLASWDLKYENQRLVCLDGPACEQPFAYMHDVGSTFGPRAMSLEPWRSQPIWADAATCTVSMKSLPYQGATFVDTRISEAGRRFLAERLAALSDAQVTGLFVGARFDDFPYSDPADADIGRWVDVFMHRVRQIVERPPCPE